MLVARVNVPYGIEGLLGGIYVYIGQPERAVEWRRAWLARGHDTHTFTRACLVVTLTLAGCAEGARTASTGLIDAAQATRNPHALSFALLACDPTPHAGPTAPGPAQITVSVSPSRSCWGIWPNT